MGGKEWKSAVTVFSLDDVHIHTCMLRLHVDA